MNDRELEALYLELKNEYKNKFCGLPKGVNIPPRFAATFCIINVNAIYFSLNIQIIYITTKLFIII